MLIFFLKSYLDQRFYNLITFRNSKLQKGMKKVPHCQYFLQCSKSFEIPNKTCCYMCVVCYTLLYSVCNRLSK